MHYLRDLGRRRLRTALTILGITIGIWALVVFGSMANKINALVEGGSTWMAGKIVVSDSSSSMSGFGGSPMALSTADAVRAVDGVDVVVPGITMPMDDGSGSMSMGVPPMITGAVGGADQGRETFPLTYAQGRPLTAADEGSDVVVLGADIARKDAVNVGDTIQLHGTPFKVVGILAPTLTAPDSAAMIPLRAAQDLYVATLPPMVRGDVQPADVISSLTVYPKPGVDPGVLAERIKAGAPGLSTMTGKDFDARVGSATAIFNAILVGIALISLVVGGLSVVNTMAMSIAERTREIGIKRAIGGSRLSIVRGLVIEAGLIGFIGGAIGLLLGAMLVTFANDAGRSSGTVLFDLTTGTAVTAIAFSTILGALAGFVPALHAARLDPVAALRYE